MYKAVIFDYDGVLADSNAFHKKALENAANSIGLRFNDDDHKDHFVGASLNEGAHSYLYDKNLSDRYEEFINKKKSHDIEYGDIIQTIPGSLEIVKKLSKKMRLAICSGARRVLIDAYLEKFALKDAFEAIVTADDVARSKPDPESYKKVLELLKLNSPEVVAIEDSLSGIRSAIGAGIFTIAITTTHPQEDLISADKIVHSFEEILKIVITTPSLLS